MLHLLETRRTSVDNTITLREIGSVIADNVSPSFDVSRFKANANEYVYPGSLVGTSISDNRFLIGRISKSIEVNPHESAPRAKVRAMAHRQPCQRRPERQIPVVA
jgi:hypothetical protein